MEGWEDADDSTAVGVNYGMITTPGNKVYYVNADAGAFQRPTRRNQRTRNADVDPRHLQTPRSKIRCRIRRRKTHRPSPSQLRPLHHRDELESSIQQAYYFAARYLGVEPPKITIERDFDFYKLLGQDVSVIGQLRAEGALSNETYLDILKSGEIIPDKVDLTAELAKIEKLTAEKEAKAQQLAEKASQANAQRPNQESGASPKSSSSPNQ